MICDPTELNVQFFWKKKKCINHSVRLSHPYMTTGKEAYILLKEPPLPSPSPSHAYREQLLA